MVAKPEDLPCMTFCAMIPPFGKQKTAATGSNIGF